MGFLKVMRNFIKSFEVDEGGDVVLPGLGAGESVSRALLRTLNRTPLQSSRQEEMKARMRRGRRRSCRHPEVDLQPSGAGLETHNHKFCFVVLNLSKLDNIQILISYSNSILANTAHVCDSHGPTSGH